jgi:hypothetical protein
MGTEMSEKVDRRLRYKIRMFRKKRCVNCGQKRKDSLFKRLCKACGAAERVTRRKRLGWKPWKEGSPGRPPLRHLARKLQANEVLAP